MNCHTQKLVKSGTIRLDTGDAIGWNSLFSELGTRQFCRDNVTTLSGHKVVCNCHYTIFIAATPSRHWGITIFRFFSSPWLVPETLLRCRVVVVAKLKNCRVPSSDCFTFSNLPSLYVDGGNFHYFAQNKRKEIFFFHRKLRAVPPSLDNSSRKMFLFLNCTEIIWHFKKKFQQQSHYFYT